MGSEVAGLHMKGIQASELFMISRNWLTLKGAVSLG